MFSRIIYSLAVADIILISFFFHNLSMLDEEALRTSPHIDISFWADYLGLIIITMILPAYLHYIRYEFKSDFEKTYNLSSEINKITTILVCDLLPFVILVLMLFGVTKRLVLGTGPGP